MYVNGERGERMKYTSAEMWQPFDGMNLEDNALTAVKNDKNTLVIAGPGAGKTEMLAQKAGFMLKTRRCRFPHKILAISFKTDAADNLKQRVLSRCGKEAEDQFVSMTYDAFFKSLLDRFYYALPEKYRPVPDYQIDDNNAIENVLIANGFRYGRLEQAKNDIKAVQLPFDAEERFSGVWNLLLKGNAEIRATLTFPMIQILVEYIVRTNEKIRRVIQQTFSHVFLDEFQDTTNLQYNFISTCFKNSDVKLTAVGDNKQRIMLWAGAKKDVFESFIQDFYADKLLLLRNYRSAPKLVELQKAMYAALQETSLDAIAADKWGKTDGNIKLYMIRDEDSEAELITQDILERINEGVKPNEISILCKQRPDELVGTLVKQLNRYNIRARIETVYQTLLKEPIVDIVLHFMRLCYNPHQAGEFDALYHYLSELNDYETEEDDNQDEKNGGYFSDIEKINTYFIESGKTIAQINNEDKLNTFIDGIISFIGEDKLKAYFPAYRQGHYFEDTITQFKQFFGEELQSCGYKWKLAFDNFIGLNSIPIMTIHKSKGLEYEAVYFLGLEDQTFWNFRNQPEEDRCAFFVAMSRAKLYLAFTFCQMRKSSRFQNRSKDAINEFFDLFQKSELVDIIHD